MALLASASAVALASMYLDAKHDLLNEMSIIRAGIQSQKLLERNAALDRNSVYYMFSERVEMQPEAEMIAFEGKSLSWLQVDLGTFHALFALLEWRKILMLCRCSFEEGRALFVGEWIEIW